MNFLEALNQAYNLGLIALAIILLAIAIITYPTLRKYNDHKKK